MSDPRPDAPMKAAIVLLFVAGCDSGGAFESAADEPADAGASSSPDAAPSSSDAAPSSPDAAPSSRDDASAPSSRDAAPVLEAAPDSCESDPPPYNGEPCKAEQLGISCDMDFSITCECRNDAAPAWFCFL